MGIIAATQANKPLELTTPLGKDALLLTAFSGSEGLSRLFEFSLDVLADNSRDIPFDQLLGGPLTIRMEMPGKKQRFFHGICSQVSQGQSDRHFTAYNLTMVPKMWLLTRKANCRIFQQITVEKILRGVLSLSNIDATIQIQGKFEPRDYCVQYRETDFNFVSRLMEEEGIYYFFKQTEAGHELVIANKPGSHPPLEGGKLLYESALGGTRTEDRIFDWQKTQTLTSGKYTLFDHSFELPGQHLEAEKQIAPGVQVGQANHKQLVADNEKLEIFDYPGEYAQRFDGIAPGGKERPEDPPKIFVDNKRTVGIRMEQEAVAGLGVQGSSTCRQMVAGHKMTVAAASNDPVNKPLKLEGDYVLTSVVHQATQSTFRSGAGGGTSYTNTFTAIPFDMPFRPQRVTPKPVVQGTQTAVVVCSPGEEIEPDKFGRVKIKFHWDRRPVNDLSSSCWVRVGTPWAGKQWGMIHIPRKGHEVIVDFLEGDPDRPIIIGSVYNAENMPPYKLPDHKTMSGVKSRSSLKGTEQNFNEIRFEDKKGKEEIHVHAERNLGTEVEADESRSVGHDRTTTIQHNDTHVVHNNSSYFVDKQFHVQAGFINMEAVGEGSGFVRVKADTDISHNALTFISHRIDESANYMLIKNDGNVAISAESRIEQGVTGNVIQITKEGKISVTAGVEIKLSVGSNSITIDDGGIHLKANKIDGTATGNVEFHGAEILLNC
jgi:type VI secretion system secreted protein VgrG